LFVVLAAVRGEWRLFVVRALFVASVRCQVAVVSALSTCQMPAAWWRT